MSRWLGVVVLGGILLAAGCGDGTPTSSNEDLLPEVSTYEVLIPFSDFVQGVELYRGFSSPADIAAPIVASSYRGELEARALLNFPNPPVSLNVRNPADSTVVPDSTYVPIGGTLVVRLDTLAYPTGSTVEVALGALTESFDPQSATWDLSADTLGGSAPWEEPGAGPVREVEVIEWNPVDGDSVVFTLDSLTATEWAHPDAAVRGAARLESRTEGTLLRVRQATFEGQARPELDPDTVLRFTREMERTTVVYTPATESTGPELLLGGAPAWRTYLRIAPPIRLDPEAAYCEGIPCPVDLTPQNLIYAGLVLHTAETAQPAFQPLDSLRVQARPAISPDRVPRSPLGPPVQNVPRIVAPAAFGPGGSARIELAMSAYLRLLLRESASAPDELPTSTLALFSTTEGGSLQYGTFRGPGQEGEPALRIIFTLFEGVDLP